MTALNVYGQISVTVTFDDATIGATSVQIGQAAANGGEGFLGDQIPHTPGQRMMSAASTLGGLAAGDRIAVRAVNGNTPIGTGYSQPLTATTCNPVAVSVTPQITTTFDGKFNTSINQLDVVFVIENSTTMAASIDKAISGFATFVNTLRQQPGGLPDLHVGVISADTGPGKFDLPAYRCPFQGDRGQFKSLPQAPCTMPPLPSGQYFLTVSNNETTQNFTGKLEDAFACIARLPNTGCVFNSSLKSLRWALDPINTPSTNKGFLRQEAPLLAVIVANQDDCSVPDDSDLFDPTQTRLTDPLGPFFPFRCNEFGHLCLINGVMQPPPRGAATNLTGCVSNETPTSKLTKLGDEVTFLKSLKPDPTLVWVATIAGPPTPYSITTTPVMTDVGTQNQPQMVPSCAQSATEQAAPAVRLQPWAQAFGDHGLTQEICADSLQPQWGLVATTVERIFHDCFPAGVRDANPATPAIEPSCTALDWVASSPQSHVTSQPLPECTSATSSTACWQMSPSTVCGGGELFVAQRPAGSASTTYFTTVTCDVCPPGVSLSGCPR